MTRRFLAAALLAWLLRAPAGLLQAAQRTEVPNLFIVPATPDLVGFEAEHLVDRNRAFRLRDAINGLVMRYGGIGGSAHDGQSGSLILRELTWMLRGFSDKGGQAHNEKHKFQKPLAPAASE